MDAVLETLYRFKVVVGALAALVFYYVLQIVSRERKIQQLGGHAAARVPIRLPFGIDFILQGVKAAAKDQNLNFWHQTFMKYGKKSNPFTFEASAGGARIILTADPENIKAILATQFSDYGKGERFNKDWHDFLGDGIFSTDHQKWHDSRQLIRPQFVKDRVSDLQTFETHSQTLMSLLGEGREVDVKDLFFKYTLDAATEFLLGRSVDSLKQSTSAFADAFGEVQRVQAIIARTGPLNWLVPRGSFYKSLKVLNQFCEPYIEDALAVDAEELEKKSKSEEGYTFIHAIARYTRDRTVLRDQLVSILLAGRDTTACTLSWTFYELGRNPRVVEKLRQEIAEQVGFDRAPTYADLKSMRYLTHTLNEVLRLYPVVPFNVRLALKDTTLPHGGGADGNQPMGVLKDTPVGYSTHYMQLRPDLYPPPSKDFAPIHVFSPERWQSWHPQSWNYIPFNGGPRICVGQQFALTEMAYTVVRILQRFSKVEGRNFGIPNPVVTASNIPNEEMLEAVTASRERMKSDIVLMPHGPIKCVFTR